MAVKRLFLYGFLALLVSGCGQAVTETLHVPESSSTPAVCATDKTVVVLPFADYSSGDDVMSVFSRSRVVTESLTDQFVTKGFRMPIEEDVYQYLADNNIIRISSQSGSSKLEEELSGEWSSVTKGEFEAWIAADKSARTAKEGASDNPANAFGTHGLDKRSLNKIGRTFNADYIVRGRIIEFDLQKEHTWALKKLGVLPFVLGGTSQAMFGFAESEEYDNLDTLALAAIAGAAIGYNAGSPFDEESSLTTITGSTITSTSTGDSDAETWNAVTWGLAGAGLAHLANHSGDTPQAVVHLRVWVQDAESGEVVWTNRAEVKVAPESIYGDKRSAELFDTAVNRAVNILVDDFWSKTKAIM